MQMRVGDEWRGAVKMAIGGTPLRAEVWIVDPDGERIPLSEGATVGTFYAPEGIPLTKTGRYSVHAESPHGLAISELVRVARADGCP